MTSGVASDSSHGHGRCPISTRRDLTTMKKIPPPDRVGSRRHSAYASSIARAMKAHFGKGAPWEKKTRWLLLETTCKRNCKSFSFRRAAAGRIHVNEPLSSVKQSLWNGGHFMGTEWPVQCLLNASIPTEYQYQSLLGLRFELLRPSLWQLKFFLMKTS